MSTNHDNQDVVLLASDGVKAHLGPHFETLAERHATSIFVVSANDVFPRAQDLLKHTENPAQDTVMAAVTDSYLSFAGQFRDVDPDISRNIRGGIFGDEFRQGMMVESLFQREPVGKGFLTDNGQYYGVIVLPPMNTSKEKLAGYELNIDTEFFDELSGSKADWMNWVIEHEATHVSKKHLNTDVDVKVLKNEIEADNGTYAHAAQLRAGGENTAMQIVETVARLRALNAVLTPVDNNHATGPAIGHDSVSPAEVILATQDVRLKIHAAIAAQDDISIEDASRIAIDDPERAVAEMRSLQELGAFEENDIAERLVTLSLEAADYHLKPGFKMNFDSADIDGFLKRSQLSRNLHFYGENAPDVHAIYASVAGDADTDYIASIARGASTHDDEGTGPDF